MRSPRQGTRVSSSDWLRRGLLEAAIIAALFCLGGCNPPGNVGHTGPVTAADTCDDGLQSESLADYAKKCSAATGVDVPGFNCDKDGTSVPEDHLSGVGYPNQFCDRPNVLNGACDPGSQFHLLVQTNDVTIVGHCRKKGWGDGYYGDIAVIQYNQKNGATCFYQALGKLPAEVTAPSEGNGANKFPWLNPGPASDPNTVSGIQCVHCHDNGPFIRSPYLAQLRDDPKNRLPGTHDGTGPWDHRFSWNQTIPYMFVGNDFQSWKAYKLSVTGTGSACLGCHRLGYSSIGGQYQTQGTAQVFGLTATAMAQAHKNPHSADSPIWMTPGQTTYSLANETEAQGAAACASAIVAKGNNPSAPDPPAACQSTQFAQGNTCRGAPIRAVLNGATQSTPSSNRSDVVVDLGSCSSGDCPLGFCYWRTLHGPFWQTTPFAIPFGDANYRGSFIRIYGEGGFWKSRAFSDPTGGPPKAPPGGTAECTNYNEIAAVPDSKQCFANPFTVIDKDGTQGSDTRDATVAGANTANVLSGLIGNIAQANTGDTQDTQDFLTVFETGGMVSLAYAHSKTPPSPLKIGPLTGESWTNSCTGWTANYVVKDVYTTSDVQLVSAAQSGNVRCFITGVTGAWSSTRNNETIQPYAEIYIGASKETRLHVSPIDGADHVGAYASCIQLK